MRITSDTPKRITSGSVASLTPTRRQLISGVAGAVGVLALADGSRADAAPGLGPAPNLVSTASNSLTSAVSTTRVQGWVTNTWRSLVAMTDPNTGLPADNIDASLAAADRSGYTSPTNIGGLLWSTIVARELGIINRGECTKRLLRTLHTVDGLQHHAPSGMFYNWYDEATGAVLTTWPTDGNRVYPFLSSVDNGWLGAALRVVMNADRGAAPLARRIFGRMRWDMFYDAAASPPGGLIHGGFYDAPPPHPAATFVGNHIGVGPDVWYTKHHYDTTVSETRITTYLGIIAGQIPARQYFALWRTFPASCDWSWQESQGIGGTKTYLGIDVFEGAYPYRGMKIVPGWGGSMFEELMPDVFVPEARWAPLSWGRNHPLHVRAQREHGLNEAAYGYWGFSPSSDPFGGYREYGVDQLGMNPDGYFSDKEKTNVDAGFGICRAGTNPNPTFGDGVVTPHASFLAMMHEPLAAFANLVRIQEQLKAFGDGGFYDAVAVRSGTIARRYLSLDQAMIMGSLGNLLAGDVMRKAFCGNDGERTLRPVIGMEEFGASG